MSDIDNNIDFSCTNILLARQLIHEEIVTAGPRITEANAEEIGSRLIRVTDDSELQQRLGITVLGHKPIGIFVTSDKIPLGSVQIDATFSGSIVVLDNSKLSGGRIHLRLRLNGECCRVFFFGMKQIINLPSVFLRRRNQHLLWGQGATSVYSQIEIEGADRSVQVGDDCMFSSNVIIRNYDMHTVFDVATGEIINPAPSNIAIEQHVWIGQNSSIIGAEHVGYGSIIGAESMLKASTPPKVMAAGVPARIRRSGVSWSRAVSSVDGGIRAQLRRLENLPGPANA